LDYFNCNYCIKILLPTFEKDAFFSLLLICKFLCPLELKIFFDPWIFIIYFHYFYTKPKSVLYLLVCLYLYAITWKELFSFILKTCILFFFNHQFLGVMLKKETGNLIINNPYLWHPVRLRCWDPNGKHSITNTIFFTEYVSCSFIKCGFWLGRPGRKQFLVTYDQESAGTEKPEQAEKTLTFHTEQGKDWLRWDSGGARCFSFCH
jgi:hypothetical protein